MRVTRAGMVETVDACLYRELTAGAGMNPERWDQVDRLLRSALERPAAERDAFLRRAYDDLLALWKDADPDLAILRDVRAEHARLP